MSSKQGALHGTTATLGEEKRRWKCCHGWNGAHVKSCTSTVQAKEKNGKKSTHRSFGPRERRCSTVQQTQLQTDNQLGVWAPPFKEVGNIHRGSKVHRHYKTRPAPFVYFGTYRKILETKWNSKPDKGNRKSWVASWQK
ncbi:hypothetical protein VIGAN_09135700 [Vigna angularis var. angularis]|uniref:Uncharacterized protein n=1 Tax=Vigna angularis var. angularis TaxID=157739 RepID=A0A0S3SYB9_PHAAN|nr:hypothetical protein VIGAN_09135700 [Vigna angularis var. angularis]